MKYIYNKSPLKSRMTINGILFNKIHADFFQIHKLYV